MKVFQHVDVFHTGDGIGNDIQGISQFLNTRKIPNYIVTHRFDQKLENIIEKWTFTNASKKDLHILHYGGFGYPIFDFLQSPGTKILKFHNITPPEYFEDYLEENEYDLLTVQFKKSIIELVTLVEEVSEVWADSAYNLKTLREWTGREIPHFQIVPIHRRYSQFSGPKDKSIVFLSRWSPHKKLEDVLLLFFYFRKICPDYTLKIIGKKNSFFVKYNHFIWKRIQDLQLEESVLILENLKDEEVLQVLKQSAVLISMSEHEGFGIPILEAFGTNTIVISFAQEAVVETMRGAGVIFHKKDYIYLAELMNLVLEKSDLQNKILTEQRDKLKYYENFPFETVFSKYLQK
jgi:glycosyltransferase involved in cell wall biosynthesis